MATSQWVEDVSEQTFDQAVIAESHRRPVLVDFWAAWCGPCRVLAPVLERMADEFAGKFKVAKLDTDTNQALAGRYRISGIPACKLFVDGQVVDEFVGALSESQVRDFLARHIKSELEEVLSRIQLDIQEGRLDAAAGALATLREKTPDHTGVLVTAVELFVAQGAIEAAEETAHRIDPGAPEHAKAQSLLAFAGLIQTCKEAGGISAATEKVNAEPSSETRYAAAACHAVNGDYPKALEHLLEIVRLDRAFGDDAARKAMLVIFERCDDDELVRDFRRQLAVVM